MAVVGFGVPDPVRQYIDQNGAPYAGGSLTFTQSGTGVAQSVYSDAALTVSLGNIVTLNAAGRTSTSASGPDTPVYFPQLTYDYTLKDANGVTIWGPITFAVNGNAPVDLNGVAGENITAGQAVYFSDGSGGKTPGLVYKADSANAYSSSSAVIVGLAVGTFASGTTGTIRVIGRQTGLSGLTVLSNYYVGTAGALTATPPFNTRLIGVADSTTSLIMGTPNLSATGMDLVQIEAFL